MTPDFHDLEYGISLYCGNCLGVLQWVGEVDAVITDPPYELGFMGKHWDKSGIAFRAETWAAIFAQCKPGAHMLAFGGSRTHHRIWCAIEDAGFDVRDTIMWIYGSGFPKSLDVSKAIDRQRQDDIRPVCRFLRSAIEASGLTVKGIADHFGFHPRMVEHWAARDTDSQPTVPQWNQWLSLRDLLSFGSEMDSRVWWLNGRKGKPGDDWERREVLGKYVTDMGGLGGQRLSKVGGNITLPATPAARQWQGWGTALKPAFEPICLARKPLDGTVAANVLKHGTGAINVDGCRIETGDNRDVIGGGAKGNGGCYGESDTYDSLSHPAGRFPANIIHDGSDEATAGFPITGTECDRQINCSASIGYGGSEVEFKTRAHAGGGTAARYFYCAKASREDRDYGCENLPERTAGECVDRTDGSAGMQSPRAGAGRTSGGRNTHPTVKPNALMRYLCRLITPPGALVLDPFMGSGSTGIAAVREGARFIGIEKDEHSFQIAVARISEAIRYRRENPLLPGIDAPEQEGLAV